MDCILAAARAKASLARPALSLACLLLLLPGPARADIVRLKSGGKLEGRVTEASGEVTVEMADGSRLTVPRAQIARIEKRKTPQELYQQRLKNLGERDTQGHYDLGLWCRQNGLYAEGARAFRKAIELDPDHAEARAALGYQRVGGAWIKGAWARLESDRFMLHYSTPPTIAQASSQGLESFYAAFTRSFCPPLRFHRTQKIPVTLFNRRAEYLEHVQEAYPLLAGKTDSLDKIPRAFTERATQRILGYIEAGEDEVLLHAVLFHETTHALVGMVQERRVRTPRWFEEAFADYLACSTAGRGEVLLGQGVSDHILFRGRMAEARAAVAEGKHIPLKDLLAMGEFDFADDRVGLMYAQSLTLLYYLVTRASADRPQAFRDYLVAVTEGRGGIEHFERIFGVKVAELEPGWRKFVTKFP